MLAFLHLEFLISCGGVKLGLAFAWRRAQTPADVRPKRPPPLCRGVHKPSGTKQCAPASPSSSLETRNRQEATPNQVRRGSTANGALWPMHQHKACKIACTAQTLTAPSLAHHAKLTCRRMAEAINHPPPLNTRCAHDSQPAAKQPA